MAEFEQAMSRLLADPHAMEEILSLAGKLGLSSPEPDRNTPPDPASPPPDDRAPQDLPFSPEQMETLLGLFRTSPRADPETMALLTALRPFLSPARQEKLDRAVRLAGVSGVIRQAMKLWKEGQLHV